MKLALTILGPNGNTYSIQGAGGIPTGGTATFNTILQDIITLIFVVGILLALVYIIWAGFNWIMSQGDKQKITAARNKITYSIIGLVVMFLAYVIINFVGTIFGVKFY